MSRCPSRPKFRPQMREYERFNTVVANAYIKPLMASYLGRLEDRLKDEGADRAVSF